MSAQGISLLALPILASAAITANRFVTFAGALAGADANAFGVSRSPAALGERFTADVQGTTHVEAGAAITAGDTIKSDATGRAITWAASGARLAIALEAASGAGKLLEVMLLPNAA